MALAIMQLGQIHAAMLSTMTMVKHHVAEGDHTVQRSSLTIMRLGYTHPYSMGQAKKAPVRSSLLVHFLRSMQ